MAASSGAQPRTNWVRRNINTFASDGKFANSLPINPATPHRYFSLEVP
jgi:hypothetical protein